uniref:Uncharacterized protein n=1 Tax=Oryza sativa subsp. japonica TaxID=39947 RepID=Q8H5D1_ORYSJ|nr:hypothetical protein [Oryza sativa Japonica Group]BAD31466.1 hypothetical protein [Oryza sativa Japonica Group]
MSYRSLLHKRILPAAAAAATAAAGAALRRPAAGSRLLQARLHQGNGRQRSSSAFLTLVLETARRISIGK